MLILLPVIILVILGAVGYILYPKNTSQKFNVKIRFTLLLPILSGIISYFIYSNGQIGDFYFSAFIFFVGALLTGLVIDFIFNYFKSKQNA